MQCNRGLAIVESVPFLMFMTVVLFDQLCIILNRPSSLERIRLHESGEEITFKRRGYKNFKVTFGGPFGWRWFLPLIIEGVFDMEELYD